MGIAYASGMAKLNNAIMTTTESARLSELESQIESNIAIVGRALFEIRESRLYRFTHSTFEDYCRERFAMSKTYINMQIQAAAVTDTLTTNGCQTVPASERQARPLAKLPADEQPAAWEKAQEIAKEEGKPLAARHVEKAVADTKSAKFPTNTPSVTNDEEGEDAERDSEKLWLLKSTWKTATKKDKEAFRVWIEA